MPAISTRATDTTEQVDQPATPPQQTSARAKPRIRYRVAALTAAAVLAALLTWVSSFTSPAGATPSTTTTATTTLWVAKTTPEAGAGVVWLQDGNTGTVANGFVVAGSAQGRFLIATSLLAHLTPGALSVWTEGPHGQWVSASIFGCPSSGPIEFVYVTLPVQIPVLQLMLAIPPGGLKAAMLGYWSSPVKGGTISSDPYIGGIVIQEARSITGAPVNEGPPALPQAGAQSVVQFTQDAPTGSQHDPAGNWVPYGKPIIDGDNRVIGMETSGTTAVTGKELYAALLTAVHSFSTGHC